jgi:diguanylate cyclase (GGDEF)-like protein
MLFNELPTQNVPPLPQNALCRDAIDYFVSNPGTRLIAVVDAQSRPVGALNRTKIVLKAAGQFGRALYDKRPLAEFIDPPQFVVSKDQSVADICGSLSGDHVTNAPDGYIVVDENGQYAGIVDGLAVLRALLAQNVSLIDELNHEVTVRRIAEREARRLADTDTLTGLSNRRVFLEAVDEAVSGGEPAVLAYLDLDRFKYLNDKFGHAVGDDALRITSSRILASRPDVFVARLGGDEFGILLRGETLDADLEAEFETLYDTICTPFVSKPGAVSVGASIGIASFPQDATSRSDWLHAADKAMQRAKQDNGGVRGFDVRIDLEQAKHARLADALHATVSNNLIKPAFQPFVDVATGRVVGHEVLARWHGPDLGFLPGPSEFIPLVERLGLIDDLFWSVAGQALETYARTGSNLKIALNVSPIQFASHLFAPRLAALAARTGIRCSQIEIEITETAMFRDMAHTVDVLRQLSDLGMTIALDDFGTGYSSLTLVKELPLTKLKIDKSFVQSAAHSASSEKIVSAAIGLSKALGILCCAEGVEDAETLARLRKMDCDLVQGFLFGRPELMIGTQQGEPLAMTAG